MFKHKFASSLALILFPPFLCFSQPFIDILNLRFQRFTPVKYYENENRQVSINQLTGSLSLLIPLKNKSILITGITYDELMFSSSNKDLLYLDGSKRSLYSVSLQIGYLKKWNEKWNTLFMVLPKLNSDQFTFTKDAYQQGGILLFTHVKKENLKYKFGLYYNREFFGNFFIPLAGIEWRPSTRLNVFGVLPGNMNVEYQLKKKLYIGLSYQSITSSFRLHGSNITSFVRNGDRFWGQNQVRIFINSYLSKNIVLFAEVGYTAFRKFEAYVARREKIDHPVFTQTKDGWLFNAGIAFRIRLDQNIN